MELSSRMISRVAFAYLWSTLFWMGLAALAAAEDKVRFLERGLRTSYWTALLIEGAFLLCAALLTPPIFAIVHRYPITKPIRIGRVAGYILGIALYIIACVVLRWILAPPWNVPAQKFEQRSLHALVTGFYVFAEIIWNSIIVLAAAHAYEYFNALTAFLSDGSSTYHGLALQVTRRMSHGLQFVGAYTYSHLIDNSTADFHTTDLTPRRQQDSEDLAADRGNSALDHRHRFTMALVYDEPFFKSGNAFTRNVLGNWEIAPIYTYQTGEWATAQSGVDANLNGDSAGNRTITNPAGKGVTGSGVAPLCRSSIPTADCTLDNVTNTAAIHPNTGATYDVEDNVVGYSALNPNAKYIQAYYGALANTGRNTILTPPTNNFDATAIKRFTITERYKVEFGVQAFNLLNHPQFIPCCVAGAGPGALGGATNAVTAQGVTGSSRNALEPQRGIFDNFSAVFPSEARAVQLSLKIFF